MGLLHSSGWRFEPSLSAGSNLSVDLRLRIIEQLQDVMNLARRFRVLRVCVAIVQICRAFKP